MNTTKTTISYLQSFALVFLLLGQYQRAFAGLDIPLSAQELSDDSDLIVVAEVLSQTSTIREGEHGKHIYTQVTLRPLATLKGDNSLTNIELEVVGGNFEGWTEVVSFSPTFNAADQVVLFLKAKPFQLVGAHQGKKNISDGKFTLDGYRIKPKDFASALTQFNERADKRRTLSSFIAEKGDALDTAPQSTGKDGASPPNAGRTVLNTDHLDGPRDLGGGTVPPSEARNVPK